MRGTNGKGQQTLAGELAKERALRAEAEEQNRVKDEFLGTLSHELRTPLNAITGWAHLLQGGALAESDRTRAVETILRNAQLQARLIEDLLDVSRIISGKLRLEASPLDLRKVVQAAVEASQPSAAAAKVELSLELADCASEVSGDAERLQQVVGNLLNNAVKFSAAGGQVRLRTYRKGRELVLEVADDGRGIAPQFLPHLFERFRQAGHPLARGKGGGLGLGLAIARYLVEAHQGTIAAASEGEGQGATFTVSLPLTLTESSTPPPPAVAAPASGRSLGGAYVLVVDDDPDALELLSMFFAREGAEVGLASSPQVARELIRTRHPDVIVCDVSMPDEDGYTFMRRLRASGERAGAFIPALALTGHAGPDDSRAALMAGFQMHVSKPLDPPRLLESVATLWRRGIARNT